MTLSSLHYRGCAKRRRKFEEWMPKDDLTKTQRGVCLISSLRRMRVCKPCARHHLPFTSCCVRGAHALESTWILLVSNCRRRSLAFCVHPSLPLLFLSSVPTRASILSARSEKQGAWRVRQRSRTGNNFFDGRGCVPLVVAVRKGFDACLCMLCGTRYKGGK